VSFRYATRAEHPVIEHVSLDVAPGEVVAMVGPSGAGKTTLTALLLRFHDVTGGRVLFEGTDVRTVRLADLRHAVGLVSQEPVLVSGTVADNVAYGRPDAARADVERAARLANAHDFIMEFPTVTTRSSASAAFSSQAVSGSASRSRARCSSTRACSSSTRRRATSMRRASRSYRTRSSA